jgi:omega-6 fatty acid desaturase (delta-12 desaturase)
MQFFVVGHDCGHRSFSKNKLVEDVVGTLMFMPLIFPFDPWRIKHNQHHAHTNKWVTSRAELVAAVHAICSTTDAISCPMCRLVEDTAWHPVQREEMANWSPGAQLLLCIAAHLIKPWT